MGDPLFTVRNMFFLGAYNTVINEASDLELSDMDMVERDVLVYRSYIAQGSYDLVISEIKDSAATALQAVKLLAQYLSGTKTKEQVLATISEWLADSAMNRNATVLLIAGTIYSNEGIYEEALKACHAGQTLELSALCVQVYLKMDRVDKAEQQLKAMCKEDDDAAITQLATAWVGVAQGGAKLKEAQYIYQEMGDKFSFTAGIYNGRAICFMKTGDYDDAERDLLEAFNKDSKNPDTLANLITCGLHLGKNVARYLTQLKMVAPKHPATCRLADAEDQFARAAASMA